MTARLLRLSAVAVVLAGFAAGSPRAAAEYVTLQYDHPTGNPAVNLKVNNVNFFSVQTGPYYWHENELPPNTSFPPPTSTFCIEVASGQPVPPAGSNATFEVLTPAAAPTIGSTAKANAVKELYGRFYDTAWNSGGFSGSAASVSFQLALWEIVYDGAGSSDLSNGNFQALGTYSQKTVAEGWLTTLNGDLSSFNTRFGGQELVALVAPGTDPKTLNNVQDQLTLRPAGVPAPPAVVLAAIGVVALLGRGRKPQPPAIA